MEKSPGVTGVITNFGKLMDPLVDKIMMAALLFRWFLLKLFQRGQLQRW